MIKTTRIRYSDRRRRRAIVGAVVAVILWLIALAFLVG